MVRLNVGCGANYADGWINVDNDRAVKADMYADATSLKVPDGMAEMVYLGHVLEYVDFLRIRPILLEVSRVLEPGGFLAVVGPDLSGIDQYKDPHLIKFLHAGGDPYWRDQYITHQWPFTERQLYTVISDVFPLAVTYPAADLVPEWPIALQPPWQCAVLASKPRSGERHHDG